MKQLSGMDAAFLAMETPNTYGHVSSLTIFEHHPGWIGGGLEVTKQMILSRLGQLEPFRRRLVTVPFGLDNPYWVEDPEFDIDYHVRHHAVPPPGTPQQLAEVVSRIIARPLDRSRPLWEVYVIEGVDNGTRIAQLNKMHHATIDGAAGAILLGLMLDDRPDAELPGPPSKPWPGEPLPGTGELLRRTAIEYLQRPEKAVRLGIRALRALAKRSSSPGVKAAARSVSRPMPGPIGAKLSQKLQVDTSGEDELPKLPRGSAPKTPFNASIGPHRRFAYTTIPLADARDIRRVFGVTFNDVVMELVADMLRRYLILHDQLPEQPLVAMVPISVRTEADADDFYRNRVSMLTCELATDEVDVVARLHRIAARMDEAKGNFDAASADALQDFANFAPPALAGRAVRLVSRLKLAERVGAPFNVVISNVPGPNHPLYSAGAELRHYYPVSTIADGVGLNVTVQSYNGRLDFGLVADRDLVPDLWTMIDLLHEAMSDLHDAAMAVGAVASSHGGKKTGAAPPAKPAAAKKAAPAKQPARKQAAPPTATPATTAPAKKTAAKRPAAKKAAPTNSAAPKKAAAKKAAAKTAAAKRPAAG